jgi:integrase
MPRPAAPWFRSSANAWYATVNGRKVSLGVRGEENRKQAVTAWHRLMGLPLETPQTLQQTPEPPQGAPQPTPPPKQESGQSLPALVAAFLADAEQRVKPESHRGYAKFLNPFAAAFKDTPPDRLTPVQVERWSKKAGWSQSYRCGFIGTVVSLFRWAVETGRLDRNPLVGIRKPKKQSRGRKAVISAEDHARLVQACHDADWRDFLELLWLTGARPGEIAGLTAEDVDLASKTVILWEHKTAEQTGKDRLIVLPDEAVNVLQRLIAKRPSGLLFPGEKGQRLTANNVSCRMRRLCQRAGVKAFCYGYRHTFATDALANGVPDAQVAALLGHAGTAMLHRHYSHLTEKAQTLRLALGKIR